MDSIFTYSNYRKYLGNLIEERKLRGKTKAELSRILGCQAAYLSQVLSERVDLTEEHLHRLGEYLEFNEVESEYLILLLRLSRAGNSSLKSYLERQMKKLRESAQELEPRLSGKKNINSGELTAYYASSWLPSVVHVATSCENLNTARAIGERFSLPENEVLSHLERLEKFGLVQFTDGRWNFAGGSIHFSKNSPIETQLQTARRLMTLGRLTLRKDSDVHYSVIFGSDAKTALEIRKHFLTAIEQVHKIVEPTPSEDIFAICLDVFRV